MSTRPIVPGSSIRVRCPSGISPAVVLGPLTATKLVWVRLQGAESMLVHSRDILSDNEPEQVQDPAQDPSLWETEIY